MEIVQRSQGELSMAGKARIAIVFRPWVPTTPDPKLYHSVRELVEMDSHSELFKRTCDALLKFQCPVLVQPIPHIQELATGIVEHGKLHVLYGETLTGENTAAIILDFVTKKLAELVKRNTPQPE